jgi:hypothetical protein
MLACVSLSTLLFALAAPQSGPSQFGEWAGRVETGVMAIGGETTGIRLVTAGPEFDLTATATIAARLRELGGRSVTVRGRLRVQPGVELRERRIVDVTEIVRPIPSVQRPGGDLIYLTFWWRDIDGRIAEKIAALPEPARSELKRRLDRRQRAEPDSFVESPEAAMDRMRADLEAALRAYSPAAPAREAADYAANATLFYEWEGFPDGPLAEAAFAAAYLEKHPDSALRQYLELFQLHRLRAAFEAAEYSAALPPRDLPAAGVAALSAAARAAADRYRALRTRIEFSSDPLFSFLAADIDAELYVYLDVGAHPGK